MPRLAPPLTRPAGDLSPGGEGEESGLVAAGARGRDPSPSPLWGEGGRRPGEGELPGLAPPLTRPAGDLSPGGDGEESGLVAAGTAEETRPPSPLWGEGGRRPGEGELPRPRPSAQPTPGLGDSGARLGEIAPPGGLARYRNLCVFPEKAREKPIFLAWHRLCVVGDSDNRHASRLERSIDSKKFRD